MTTKNETTKIAQMHLQGINWSPEQGLSNEALGLSYDDAGWAGLDRDAVWGAIRALATAATEAAEMFRAVDLSREAAAAVLRGETVERLTGEWAPGMASEVLVVGGGRAGVVTNGAAVWGDWLDNQTIRTDESHNGRCLLLDINGNDVPGCLEDLLALVPTMSERALTSLPTFGGEAPASTNGVFSWDSSRLLVQDRTGWRIIPRSDRA